MHGHRILTQVDGRTDSKEMARSGGLCHFDEGDASGAIRMRLAPDMAIAPCGCLGDSSGAEAASCWLPLRLPSALKRGRHMTVRLRAPISISGVPVHLFLLVSNVFIGAYGRDC